MSYVRMLTATLCLGVVAIIGFSLAGTVHAQGEKPPVVKPPEIKPEVKPEVKGEPKADPKTETKAEPKADPKVDPKVEVKQEGKDAPAPEEKKDPIEELKAELAAASGKLTIGLDTLWVMVCGMLVFFMNLGFGCVESGFARAKNCVNILSKNFIVFAVTSIFFWLFGWGIMFGGDAGTAGADDYIGKDGVMMVNGGVDNSPSIASFGAALKEDVKTELGIDLDDEKDKEKYPKVVEAVDDYSTKFMLLKSNTVEKKDDKGKVEKVDATFPVKIAANGKTLEKDYTVKDYYWGPYSSISWTGVPLWAKFFFQLVFAGTAATIVSGAVAERIKYHSFIVFSAFMAVVMYPVTGHWIWGGGWLADAGFWDFAGCAVVHSVGGWAAMTGAFILGPRIGKYGPDGKIKALPGHNMMAAFIGCLVLWLGWFGFNPGSTMSVGDGSLLAKIAVNTNAAAAASTITATITAWLLMGKPDIGMTLNGCLAGLVAITAPCAWVDMNDSLIIGAVAGSFVVFSVMFFDRIRCDDPVGATSVHLGCGTLGCIAVGLFAEIPAEGALAPKAGLFHGGGTEQLLIQIKGVLAVGVYTVVVSTVCWFLIKLTLGLRVSPHEEIEGLDIGEHGNEAYHGFQMIAPEILMGGAEPRPAMLPTDGKKRFTVVVEGLPAEKIASVWGDLCKPAKDTPADFIAIYPKMTMLQGTKFKFIDGNPETISSQLAKVLQAKSGGAVKTFVEK